MKSPKKLFPVEKLIFLTIGAFTLLAIIAIIIFSISEGKNEAEAFNITAYSINDKEKPQAVITSDSKDLGTMDVKDEKRADFTLENKGTKPLQLYKISSSCDCTYGQITIDGNTSPEFSMHSKSKWIGSLDPGKTAILTAVYRPFIMPVKGEVTRYVYLQTNDPENSSLTFTIRATIE